MTSARRSVCRAERAVVVALGLAILLSAAPARAHKPSDSYLAIGVVGADVTGQWDIALRDLDYAIGLDADADGAVTWGELRTALPRVSDYAFGRLALQYGDAPCRLAPTELLVDRHGDGAYAVARFRADCDLAARDPAAGLTVTYRLFSDVDALHRGLVAVTFAAPTEIRTSTGYDDERSTLATLLAHGKEVAVLGPDEPTMTFTRRSPSRGVLAGSFVRDGIWHIVTGYDHLLFLLSLLLPAVARRTREGWWSVPSLRDALGHVVGVVTAFTVAHSVTLSLAALGLVDLPSRLVETSIAISVALAAANNLVPIVSSTHAWRFALVFGLIHGFGFASVLGDLTLPRSALTVALVSFNVGVEIGQLAVIVALLPFAFLARHTTAFRWGVMSAGSAATVAIALVWASERAFDFTLF